MREPWVAYVVVGLVVALMMLGKYLIARGDKIENIKKQDNKKSKND